MTDSTSIFLGVLPANIQVLPPSVDPVPADQVLYAFKGVCAGLNQPTGAGCTTSVSGALDAIEAAICSLQAGGGGGSSGGVTLNCGTLAPLLTAGNCVPLASGAPPFIAGYAAAGAPLRYYAFPAQSTPFINNCADFNNKLRATGDGTGGGPSDGCLPFYPADQAAYIFGLKTIAGVNQYGYYAAPPAPFISDCANFITRLKATTNGGCVPTDLVSAVTVLAFDGLGNPIVRPLPTGGTVSQFIPDCPTFVSKLKSAAAGGCLPEDTAAATKVIAIDAVSGNPVIRPAPAGGGSGTQFIASCADLIAKIKTTVNGGCLPTDNTVAATVLAFDTAGAAIVRPLPVVTIPTPFIADCAGLLNRLKATFNGGCLPTDAVTATTVIAIDATGGPIIRPLPATSTPFIADCTGLLNRLKATANGGCIPSDSIAAATVIALDPISGNPIARPLPNSSTPFIAGCADLLAKLKSTAVSGCLPEDTTTATKTIAIDAVSGNPVIRPLPAVVPTFIADCAGLLTRLKATTNGGCLPTTATPTPNQIGIDATGNAVIAPQPTQPTPFISNCADFNLMLRSGGDSTGGGSPNGCIAFFATGDPVYLLGIQVVGGVTQYGYHTRRQLVRWELNGGAASTATGTVTAITPVTMLWTDSEAVKQPVDATLSGGTTMAIGHDAYYSIEAGGLARLVVPTLTSIPANSAVSLTIEAVITRPAAAAVVYRLGQSSIILQNHPIFTTGNDIFYSGKLAALWLPAGTTISIRSRVSNIANAGALTVTLSNPAGGGNHFGITEMEPLY